MAKKMQIRHKRSFFFTFEDVTETQDKWLVRSQFSNQRYVVEIDPKDCRCRSKCHHCEMCKHTMKCSCPDHSKNGFMCKHIHLVGRYRRRHLDQSQAERMLYLEWHYDNMDEDDHNKPNQDVVIGKAEDDHNKPNQDGVISKAEDDHNKPNQDGVIGKAETFSMLCKYASKLDWTEKVEDDMINILKSHIDEYAKNQTKNSIDIEELKEKEPVNSEKVQKDFIVGEVKIEYVEPDIQ